MQGQLNVSLGTLVWLVLSFRALLHRSLEDGAQIKKRVLYELFAKKGGSYLKRMQAMAQDHAQQVVSFQRIS